MPVDPIVKGGVFQFIVLAVIAMGTWFDSAYIFVTMHLRMLNLVAATTGLCVLKRDEYN